MYFDWRTWGIWLIGLIILVIWIYVPVQEFRKLVKKKIQEQKNINSKKPLNENH